jgi:serine/threonine-protein kinase
LTGATHGVFSSKPQNVVVAEHPAATTKVARGSTVTLDVSKGKKPVPVPDVTGQQVAAAIETLRAQGMRATVVQVPSDQPAGQVVAQHPAAGQTAATGTTVRLNASGGPTQSSPTTSTAPSTSSTPTTTPATAPASTPVTVPDLQGQKLADARKTLRRAGLVTEVRKVPSSLPKDSIVAQSPKPGTTAKRGDHVFVTVSLGPKDGAGAPAAAHASVPNVLGEDESTATADLRAAGFAVEVVDRSTTDQSKDGIVIEQTPAASRTAAAGSTVTIYVGRFGG